MKDFMYDDMYDTYQTHWWHRTKREIVTGFIQDIIERSAGGKETLVDFGCGCGSMLASLTGFGAATGIDSSERALRYCQKGCDCELLCLDLSEPMQCQARYSIGIASDVFEHIQEDSVAAKNLYELLLAGGHAIVTVPAHPWLWSAHDENCMHKRRYTKSSFRELLQSAGFSITFLSYYNCILFVPALVGRMLIQILRLDKDGDMEGKLPNKKINRILYRCFSLEKGRLLKRKSFPFGLSLIAIVEKPSEEKEREMK